MLMAGATATAAAAAAAAAHAGVEPRADASGRSGKGAGAGAGGSFAFYDDDDDDDDDSPGSRVVDPADALFEQRASHLRFLRALELRDEAERQARRREEEEEQTMTMTTTTKEAITVLSSGHRVLAYDSFLDNQRYYDDLKHVDCHFIYYERSNLIIEQDKTLGKGGLCWDAAFILAEYLVATAATMSKTTTTRIIELGSGTGLCGLMLAKSLLMTKKTPDCQFTVTDLPELLPLLERNLEPKLCDRTTGCRLGRVFCYYYRYEYSRDATLPLRAALTTMTKKAKIRLAIATVCAFPPPC